MYHFTGLTFSKQEFLGKFLPHLINIDALDLAITYPEDISNLQVLIRITLDDRGRG